MNIFKATFFQSGDYRIEKIVCQKLTFDAVVISRSLEEMHHLHTNRPIIAARETKYQRYCSTNQEAVGFIDTKYCRLIEDKKANLCEIETKLKALLLEES